MKVILLHDVPKIGRKGQVKNVSDGHAVNFLIPRKLAVFATSEAMKHAQETQAQQANASELELSALRSALKELSGKTIMLSVNANEHGHLFRGIDAQEIVKAIANQAKLTLEAKAIDLERPIKETGEHALHITAGGISASVTLSVEKAR